LAITHFTAQIISRGDGRSAVLSAAYRHCAKMEHQSEKRTVDYSNKGGLVHEEFLLPPDAPTWIRERLADRSVSGAAEVFWNEVEQFEKRSDAQFAREFIMALPVELTVQQNIALIHDFVSDQILKRGQVADWVYHNDPGNPHVHLMTTLRPLTTEGFGAKKMVVTDKDGEPLRNPSGKIVYRLWTGEKSDLLEQREHWLDCQNRHLALAGFDVKVDGRSYAVRGIDIVPAKHIGVTAKAIERRAQRQGWDPDLDSLRVHEKIRSANARRIVARPDIVLDLVSREMSVFREQDIAKILHRYFDDAQTFQQLMLRILQRPQVIRLEAERFDFAQGSRLPAKFTTRELIGLEAELIRRSVFLSKCNAFMIKRSLLDAVFSRHSKLSDEQKAAIRHVMRPGRLAAVIGRAGAGKTTMMKAAREAWEAAGYRVVGGALAGKAAEGLEQEAGIASRTLASWELHWQKDREPLNERTIFVLDEAGMVSSRQMALFVETVAKSGAKIVLVGDPEQLQPIEAGAAFRAIVAHTGYSELQKIYRQRHQWMRDASLDLAQGRVANAISAYQKNGKVLGCDLKTGAIAKLIGDWDRDYDPSQTTLILAHLRRDVHTLNALARERLIRRGIINEGHLFKTDDGDRRFAPGDQIVFLKNEASLGVKNGMIAQIAGAEPGRIIVEIKTGRDRHLIEVNQRFYTHVDYGYAITVHKSQGATVDQVKVLASLSLDRHLIYVALTRHRNDVVLYYGSRSFHKAGGLVPVLSRPRTKETTLDYEDGRFYRAALAYAENRGLHIVRVARTLVADKLKWTVRQKQKLVALGNRLASGARALGVIKRNSAGTRHAPVKSRPLVPGITTFPKSLSETVEDKLAADLSLKSIWNDVSLRFRLVFADPTTAFAAIDFDKLLIDPAVCQTTMATLAQRPETFGALCGKTGLFSRKSDQKARHQAESNVPALKRDVERFVRVRAECACRYEQEERALRARLAIHIPALSPDAAIYLEQIRNALDSNDPSAALTLATRDPDIKAQIEELGTAVRARFGERAFLGTFAKDPGGTAFRELTAGMAPAQATAIRMAWPAMCTAQQLAVLKRSTEAQRQSQVTHLAQRRGGLLH
jgi:Ti-type conjugative transfer relaxase TraA